MLNSTVRRLMTLAIATAMIMLLVGGRMLSASRISTLNEQAARHLVMQHVPATAVHLDTVAKDAHFQFKYYDIPTTLHYLIDIDRQTGAVDSIEARLSDPSGSAKVLLDESTVRWLLNRHFRNAAIESLRLKTSGDRKRYLVSFTWTGLNGSASISPETGQILEYTLEKVRRATISLDDDPVVSVQPAAVTRQLPVEQIGIIALDHIVGGSIIDIRLEPDVSKPAYVVQMVKSSGNYRLVIDAVTGIVLSNRQEERPAAERGIRSVSGGNQSEATGLRTESGGLAG